MRGKRYPPLSVVIAVCGWMSAWPLRVTVTPGNTAPVPSVAFPKISPVLTCASAGIAPASNKRHPIMPARRSAPLIHPPGLGAPPLDLQTDPCPDSNEISGNGHRSVTRGYECGQLDATTLGYYFAVRHCLGFKFLDGAVAGAVFVGLIGAGCGKRPLELAQ